LQRAFFLHFNSATDSYLQKGKEKAYRLRSGFVQVACGTVNTKMVRESMAWTLSRTSLSRYTFLMALRLYAATTSAGKLRDFRTAAQAHQVNIEPLTGIEKIKAPEENGDTFLANAAIKAMYYSRFVPGELVVADDSGLEVDALGGAPGVRSARYAADSGLVDSPDANDNTDVWNNMLLLQKMEGIPETLRTARYHCTLVAARDGAICQVADGLVEGLILEAPRGTGGFGYDPLFYLSELGKTMAEIDLETKLSLSHRGRAIVVLLANMRG
jgi:XTP/dITP diphosphohydrolase